MYKPDSPACFTPSADRNRRPWSCGTQNDCQNNSRFEKISVYLHYASGVNHTHGCCIMQVEVFLTGDNRDEKRTALRLPNQSDSRDARRPLEFDRHPGRHVRESPALRGSSEAFRRRNSFEHSGGPAEMLSARRLVVTNWRPDSQAKGDLQSYRRVHRTRPTVGAYGRLGTAAYSGFERTRGPRTAPRRGGRKNVESFHG